MENISVWGRGCESLSPADLLQVLSHLHQWEIRQQSLLSTNTGRHLYYALAPHAMAGGQGLNLKEVVVAPHLTDRALRARLVQAVQQGLLTIRPHAADHRTKVLVPLEPFFTLMHAHTAELHRLVAQQRAAAPMSPV
jgi:hypothetical protein